MLSVIIVNWNVKNLLIKNLESIFSFTKNIDYEIIVVDNGSTDGSAEELNKKFSREVAAGKLKILDTKKNNGFSRGNNIGFEASKGDYVLFMNPDMELVENSFKILENYLKSHLDVGAVSCILRYPDDTLQKSVKGFPTLFSQAIILLKLHHLLFWFGPVKRYLARDFDYSKEQEAKQLMGAFIMMRREVFEKIGKWDEDYWLFWEDVELAYQLKKNSIKTTYIPNTKVVHHESKSFEQQANLARQRSFNKGMLIYFKKHGSKFDYFILKLLQPWSLFLAMLTQMLRIRMRQQSRI
ncbi:MAG: glycosyltransferase family 2 protein [bacterium]